MERTLIQNLSEHVGKTASIKASMNLKRDHGSVAFLVVEDRTGEAQVVVETPELLEKIQPLQPGTVLKITGEVKECNAKHFKVEIVKPEIDVLTSVTKPMPVDLSKPDLNIHIDTDLDYRSITLRHPKHKAVFKIQAKLAQAYREYMIAQSATEFFGPAMTSACAEGGAEVFKLPYFESKATLAQSNQLYKQMLAGVYERVFSMAKCFRAEKSNTRRHLTEAIQYEFEMTYIDSFHDVMDILDGAIKFMIAKIKTECSKEIELLKVKLPLIPEEKIPRIHFKEALKIIEERLNENTSHWKDLTTEAERELCAYTREKFGSDFVFITNYGKGVFYCYKNKEGEFQNFDLLCREAEIVSGGQRINNYDDLVSSIKENKMDPEAFHDYLEIFKFGMPPHGGFGMGLERSTMLFLGLENIRDACAFPSDPKRIAGVKI